MNGVTRWSLASSPACCWLVGSCLALFAFGVAKSSFTHVMCGHKHYTRMGEPCHLSHITRCHANTHSRHETPESSGRRSLHETDATKHGTLSLQYVKPGSSQFSPVAQKQCIGVRMAAFTRQSSKKYAQAQLQAQTFFFSAPLSCKSASVLRSVSLSGKKNTFP